MVLVITSALAGKVSESQLPKLGIQCVKHGSSKFSVNAFQSLS